MNSQENHTKKYHAHFFFQTYVKIFDESPHVAHFYTYPKEYVAVLYEFLQKLNLIQNEEKIRARL